MKINPLPSFEYLNECFIIDPTSESGLRWRERPISHFKHPRGTNIRFAGTRAGTVSNRYWSVLLDKKGIRVHRIIYFLENPDVNMEGLFIDHIDGDTMNNKKENLRLATTGQNQWNARAGKNSKYGRGIKRVMRLSGICWTAKINVNKKTIRLGTFKTHEAAQNAYNGAAIKYYGEFARIVQITS